ncbi:DUF928 domain-containing protein [Microcoleus sp.]|uniref:DUF928 domain-containing protein n=1 Tax=Microcoleus sp. TaxID=44472 RepID=UPI0035263553
MAWTKCHLNTVALSLILSLEAVATVNFSLPAKALNSPTNSVSRPDIQYLPLQWQTVQFSSQTGTRLNSQPIGMTWNNFQPPEQGVPGRREGGGTRGSNCPSSTTALIPKSTMGRTLSPKPTFFYYVPVAVDKKVEFELADEKDKTIYKKSFHMVTSRAGIVNVSLAKDGTSPVLEVGKNYHWYFSIKCNPQNSQEDVLVSGWINRTALAPSLKTELERSSGHDRLSIFTQQGIWYEYLATLAQLRLSSPSDAHLALQWSEMLSSVELGTISQAPLVPTNLNFEKPK